MLSNLLFGCAGMSGGFFSSLERLQMIPLVALTAVSGTVDAGGLTSSAGASGVDLGGKEGMLDAVSAIWPPKGADNPMAFMIVAICCSLSSLVLPSSRRGILGFMMVAPAFVLFKVVYSSVGCDSYRNRIYLCRDTKAVGFVVESVVRVELSDLW